MCTDRHTCELRVIHVTKYRNVSLLLNLMYDVVKSTLFPQYNITAVMFTSWWLSGKFLSSSHSLGFQPERHFL